MTHGTVVAAAKTKQRSLQLSVLGFDPLAIAKGELAKRLAAQRGQ